MKLPRRVFERLYDTVTAKQSVADVFISIKDEHMITNWVENNSKSVFCNTEILVPEVTENFEFGISDTKKLKSILSFFAQDEDIEILNDGDFIIIKSVKGTAQIKLRKGEKKSIKSYFEGVIEAEQEIAKVKGKTQTVEIHGGFEINSSLLSTFAGNAGTIGAKAIQLSIEGKYLYLKASNAEKEEVTDTIELVGETNLKLTEKYNADFVCNILSNINGVVKLYFELGKLLIIYREGEGQKLLFAIAPFTK